MMKTVQFAIKQTVPILFSYIFVGIAYGILVHEAGYPAILATVSALLVYAGSMQLIMISLITSGVPLYMIAIMTLFINGRHIFYGLGFIGKFQKMGWKYPYMAITLTDETYSVLCATVYPKDMDEQKIDFTIAFFCHMLWVCSCTLGALAGQYLPLDMAGIEFSATAFFVTVCVNQWRQFGSRIPAIAGFVSAIVFYILLGPDKFLLPALAVSLLVLMILKERVTKKMEGESI